MGIKKLAAKIDAYKVQLEQGKAHKILPTHVLTILGKLRAKEEELMSEIEHSPLEEDRGRLDRKLQVAREQIVRAEYLLNRVR